LGDVSSGHCGNGWKPAIWGRYPTTFAEVYMPGFHLTTERSNTIWKPPWSSGIP
jgi:hypothetical protein